LLFLCSWVSALDIVAAGAPPSLILHTPTVEYLFTVTVNGVTLPGTPGTQITRIQWSWGDGGGDRQWFPAIHVYSDFGDYTITVTSYQSDGQSTTRTTSISLKLPEPSPPTSGQGTVWNVATMVNRWGSDPTVQFLLTQDVMPPIAVKQRIAIYSGVSGSCDAADEDVIYLMPTEARNVELDKILAEYGYPRTSENLFLIDDMGMPEDILQYFSNIWGLKTHIEKNELRDEWREYWDDYFYSYAYDMYNLLGSLIPETGYNLDLHTPLIIKKWHELTITVAPEASGITSPAEGKYWYGEGSQVTVTESENSGFQFDHWNLDGGNVGNQPSITIQMNVPYTLVGIFSPVPEKGRLYVTLTSSDDDYHDVDVYVDNTLWKSFGVNPRETINSEDLEVDVGNHDVRIEWYDSDCGGKEYAPPSITQNIGASERVEFQFDLVMPFYVPTNVWWTTIDATLEETGVHSFFYVATSGIPECTRSQLGVNQLKTEFETSYVVETQEDVFGQPPDEDEDGHIYILIYDSNTISGKMAHVNYANEQLWNKAEIIYLDHAIATSNQVDYTRYTLAHELNHLIMYEYDPNEERWIQEGMAEFAKFVVYQKHADNAFMFLRGGSSSASLVHNPELFGDFSMENYGAAYLFFLYIYEHHGGMDTIQAIFQDASHGKESVESHLLGSLSFEDVFQNWAIANYADADGTIYGYATIDIKQEISNYATSHEVASDEIIHGSKSLVNWAADYVWFTTDEAHLKISFEGFLGSLGPSYEVKILLIKGSFFDVISMDMTPLMMGDATIGPPLMDYASSYSQIVLVTTRYGEFYPTTPSYEYSARAYSTLLKIEGKSPVNIRVTAPDGLRVGYDPDTGGVINEIPGAIYSGLGTEPQVIEIPNPLEGTYTVDVYGTGSGLYTITLTSTSTDGTTVDTLTWKRMATSGREYTKTVELGSDGTITAPTPVGGVWIPVNRTELLAPWLSLASLMVVSVASIVYVNRRKKKS